MEKSGALFLFIIARNARERLFILLARFATRNAKSSIIFFRIKRKVLLKRKMAEKEPGIAAGIWISAIILIMLSTSLRFPKKKFRF